MAGHTRCDRGGGADFRRSPGDNPCVEYGLNRDAYVNGYGTLGAPGVIGQVARVLVDDNNRVKTGDVLVELDPEPYQVQVAINQAIVNSARANLVEAQAAVRGLVGQMRSQRFKLARAIEDVDNQIQLVRALVATWEQSKATLVLAQAEFDRADRLLGTRGISAEEWDQRREALDVARAQVQQALENVYQARVALGLPAQPPAGTNLTEVPADLDQTFSSVRQAQADLIQGAAQLGVVASSYDQPPNKCWMNSVSVILVAILTESTPTLLRTRPA